MLPLCICFPIHSFYLKELPHCFWHMQSTLILTFRTGIVYMPKSFHLGFTCAHVRVLPTSSWGLILGHSCVFFSEPNCSFKHALNKYLVSIYHWPPHVHWGSRGSRGYRGLRCDWKTEWRNRKINTLTNKLMSVVCFFSIISSLLSKEHYRQQKGTLPYYSFPEDSSVTVGSFLWKMQTRFRFQSVSWLL